MGEELNVAFIGNPNSGKTTLFNAYTGSKLKVANWPGVTVEKKEGAFKYHKHKFKLVDLPGIYSLTSYTMEEKVSREYIMQEDVDVVVDVVDASSLERNLYLTLQLIELGKPVILALNMMDIVQERGMEIDLHRLEQMLGIPIIPVSARKKTGLEILMHTVAHHKSKTTNSNLEFQDCRLKRGRGRCHRYQQYEEYTVAYSKDIEDKIDGVSVILRREYPNIKNTRWHAMKLLEQDAAIIKKYPINISHIVDKSYETDIINQKYDFIEEIIEEVVVHKESKVEATEKIDKILTNQYLGVPIFLGIMALVFFLTFAVGDFLKGGFEIFLEYFSSGVNDLLVAIGVGELMISLIVDGVIAGVGGILSFLPNIFILFLALAFLEDSGYMSRVAYVMDGLMGKIGLSGKAFIPMLLGFGCTVPAVMASRALEDVRDRWKTIIITPFMSCSAKIPIYVLFSNMFFGKYAMWAALSMYLLGIIVGIVVAITMKLFEKKKEINTLLIELPEYKTPNLVTVGIYVWEKIKEYLVKAGTTIFIASVIVWFILNFGVDGFVGDMKDSYGASIGKFMVPFLEPAGLGIWQMGLALISGLAAKEVVVSSLTVLFNVGNINSQEGMNSLVDILANQGFGALNAYAFMIFALLYTPCVATIATVTKELKSWKWSALLVVFQLGIAWSVATLFYQIGKLFL
jgi:ferrous iron transport protein B